MTATSYRFLGVPMQRQSARRKLVVITYGVLAVLCGSALAMHFLYGEDALLPYSVAIYGSLAVGTVVFGGMGRPFGRWGGLIKPFANKRPRPEPPMVTLVALHLQPESLVTPDDAGWRNDERELSVRDRAHYKAYQVVLGGVAVILLLAFWELSQQRLIAVNVLQSLLFTVALATTVLAITLPSAIILWNEPDIDLG